MLGGGGHRGGLSFGPQMVSVDGAKMPAAGWIGPEFRPRTAGDVIWEETRWVPVGAGRGPRPSRRTRQAGGRLPVCGRTAEPMRTPPKRAHCRPGIGCTRSSPSSPFGIGAGRPRRAWVAALARASEVLVTSTVQMLGLGSGSASPTAANIPSKASPASGTCSQYRTPKPAERKEQQPVTQQAHQTSSARSDPPTDRGDQGVVPNGSLIEALLRSTIMPVLGAVNPVGRQRPRRQPGRPVVTTKTITLSAEYLGQVADP